MRWEPLGDSGFILRDLSEPAYLVADWLNRSRLPGMIEAVASYETVGLYTTPGFDPDEIDLPLEFDAPEPRRHSIPVCYEMGDDLESSAQLLKLGPEEL